MTAARRNVLFSGGEGSFRATLASRIQHPDVEHRLVFTDTLYEDADTYRFLIEAAHRVFDRAPPNWLPQATDFPEYRVSEDVPITDYQGNPEWRAFLAELRERTQKALPQMVWLVEGRDPWEIFRDRRFLGNPSRDPCSEIAKRKHLVKWQKVNCTPGHDVFVVGIGSHEAHRFDDGEGHGYAPRMAQRGFATSAPLIETEDAIRCDGPRSLAPGALRALYAPVRELGVQPGRNYALGYAHDNCGGFCCKAGIGHWSNRWRVQRSRFEYDAMMERKIIAHFGRPVSMLSDRRGSSKTRLTLDDLGDRLKADPQLHLDILPGESGCGCMVMA